MEAVLLSLAVAHQNDDGPEQVDGHENEGDHARHRHDLGQDALLDPGRPRLARDEAHEVRAACVGGEAEPEEHGVPGLQHLLRTFGPHPDRVEDEGEGDEDDRGQQHGVILLAIGR